MGDKKRRTSAATDAPSKSKKPRSADVAATDKMKPPAVAGTADGVQASSTTKVDSLLSTNASAVPSKKSRKRAADFMDDEKEALAEPDTSKKSKHKKPIAQSENGAEDEPVPKKSKKSKTNHKDKSKDQVLTADGVNGVVERAGDEKLETVTTHKPIATSMQAEAERTVDQELEDGLGGFASEDDDADADADEVEEAGNAAALLAGFDSDNEDDAEDKGDLTTIPALPTSKKVQKKLDKIKAEGKDDGPGSVYVGRIPHGFYEKQMKEYFSQFGEITRLRLSRNKRTGNSRHFAFLEFESDEVAKIVAETMNNYLMFGHILKCTYCQPGALHPDTWKGANKKFRKIPYEKLQRETLAAPKTEEKWQKAVDKEQRKREKKAEQLKAIGLDMPNSTLTKPSDVLRQRALESAGEDPSKPVGSRGAAPAGAVVRKDEVATEPEKKPKKNKKDKKATAAEAEAPVDTPVVDDVQVETKAGKPVTEPTKAKKDKKQKKVVEAAPAAQEPVEAKLEQQVEAATKPKKSKKPNKDKDASKKAAAEVIEEIVEGEVAEPAVQEPTSTKQINSIPEKAADFLSFDNDDDLKDVHETAHNSKKKVNPRKKEAEYKKAHKKERKNLVKARGPKSGLVSTKP